MRKRPRVLRHPPTDSLRALESIALTVCDDPDVARKILVGNLVVVPGLEALSAGSFEITALRGLIRNGNRRLVMPPLLLRGRVSGIGLIALAGQDGDGGPDPMPHMTYRAEVDSLVFIGHEDAGGEAPAAAEELVAPVTGFRVDIPISGIACVDIPVADITKIVPTPRATTD